MANAFKALILAVVPTPDPVPLEQPPMSSEERGLVCPGCGAMNGAKLEVENASVARCPDCQSEWSMQEDRQSHLVLGLLTEHHADRRRLVEAMA